MLRRAYAIPDGVSDASAETVIARIFEGEHRGAGTMQMVQSTEGLVRLVIQEVLVMFEESTFDRRLLPEEHRRYLDEDSRHGGSQDWREQLLGKLRDTENWTRPPYTPPIGEVIAIAEAIVEKLCDYHAEHPELVEITRL